MVPHTKYFHVPAWAGAMEDSEEDEAVRML